MRNFPTAVFGISSTNSKRSGSHHFAKLGARCSRSSSAVADCALAQHAHRERPLRPLLVGDRDHRRLGDRRVPHQRVLERDGRDPLAAGLDEVLGAVLDLDVAVGVDRDDVAGLEPAVVRPAVGRVRGVEVGRGDRRAAHLELAHASRRPRGRALRRLARGSRRTGSAALAAHACRTRPHPRGPAPGPGRPRSSRSGTSRSSPSRG